MSLSGLIKALVKRTVKGFGYELIKIPFLPSPPEKSSWKTHAMGLPGPVRLHFGCGPRILKGWLNIDLSYEHFDQYLKWYTNVYYPLELRGDRSDFFSFDVTKGPLPLPSDCVDVIFHEDFLEHLNQRDQVLFLAETRRVMKPGAIHRVNTPHLLMSMQSHSNFQEGYGGVHVQEWNQHGHLNVLTPRVLEELAVMCGYSRVVFTGRNQSMGDGVPLEYRPDPRDRPEEGNIFADLIK